MKNLRLFGDWGIWSGFYEADGIESRKSKMEASYEENDHISSLKNFTLSLVFNTPVIAAFSGQYQKLLVFATCEIFIYIYTQKF